MSKIMWDQTDQLVREHEQNMGRWIRLDEDGDKFAGVFLGGPYPRQVVWDQNTGHYEDFTEAHKASGISPALRISFNVAVTETNIGGTKSTFDPPSVRVWQSSMTAYKSLCTMRDKYTLQCPFEVKREGKKNDPNTTYVFLPEPKLSDEVYKQYEAMERHDLKAEHEEESGRSQEGSSMETYKPAKDEAPANHTRVASPNGTTIPSDVSQTIVSVLKQLPDDAVKAFLSEFEVSKVKLVPANQAEKAVAFVEQLDAKYGANSTSENPFT